MITPQTLSDYTLLDVRTPAEFKSMQLDGALNIPLDQLAGHPEVAAIPSATKLLLICASGPRADKAQRLLSDAGFTDLQVLPGGMNAWSAAGHPVIRGQATMSLERQVRIAAGFLVFTGVMLGLFVHPGFYGLSAFVGAGLMFAGITDTCAMGLLIAKLPWNR